MVDNIIHRQCHSTSPSSRSTGYSHWNPTVYRPSCIALVENMRVWNMQAARDYGWWFAFSSSLRSFAITKSTFMWIKHFQDVLWHMQSEIMNNINRDGNELVIRTIVGKTFSRHTHLDINTGQTKACWRKCIRWSFCRCWSWKKDRSHRQLKTKQFRDRYGYFGYCL